VPGFALLRPYALGENYRWPLTGIRNVYAPEHLTITQTADAAATDAASPDMVATGTTANMHQVLFGRLMLPDQSEFPFQISQISPDGATILTEAIAPEGVKIVAYIDDIGRVEANVIATFDGGIGLEFIVNSTRRSRLEQKLQWLSENDKDDSNLRRHDRFEPKETKTHITMPDGRMYQTEVIDISLGGAAIKTDIMPNLGTCVLLGKMHGRVVRYIEDGIAIEFFKLLTHDTLSDQVS